MEDMNHSSFVAPNCPLLYIFAGSYLQVVVTSDWNNVLNASSRLATTASIANVLLFFCSLRLMEMNCENNQLCIIVSINSARAFRLLYRLFSKHGWLYFILGFLVLYEPA